MEPSPRICGMLAAGFNPAAVDAALATIVGFDIGKIPVIRNAFQPSAWPITDFGAERVSIRMNMDEWRPLPAFIHSCNHNFMPPSGWRNHIEL